MEKTISVHHQHGLDITIIHAIINEAACFEASTFISYNEQFVNLKSMKNCAIFFQQPFIGEMTVVSMGCDEYYALMRMISVIERYLNAKY
ncbi:MAG: HPr family phosphocarrier protein [Coprobacillus sp.]